MCCYLEKVRGIVANAHFVRQHRGSQPQLGVPKV